MAVGCPAFLLLIRVEGDLWLWRAYRDAGPPGFRS